MQGPREAFTIRDKRPGKTPLTFTVSGSKTATIRKFTKFMGTDWNNLKDDYEVVEIEILVKE
jgi:hypothetical protein